MEQTLVDARTILLFVVLFLAVYWLFSRQRNLPPGPRGVPLLGSVPALIWGVMRGRAIHDIFRDYSKKYGSVFHLRIFNKSVVVLGDYAMVKQAFHGRDFTDRPKMLLGEAIKSEGVAMASGEVWMELRRFSMTVLRSLGVGKSSFEEKIGTEGEEVLKEITSLKGKPFHPRLLLSNATANIICSVVFGKRYEYTDLQFHKLLSLFSEILASFGAGGALNFFPALKYLPMLNGKKIMDNFEKILQFISKVIDKHRAEFDPDDPKDFTDAYLLEVMGKPINPEAANRDLAVTRTHLSERNMIGNIVNLFAAGTNATSIAIEWCLLTMVAYPDIQQRVQDEIDDVVGRNRLPRLADKDKLNFTQAVIWEVHRMYVFTPLGIPHAASADGKLAGFVVPKGSLIVANFWAISRDANTWDEPDKFKPERFLTEDGKALKPEELIPFSTGRRSCIGEHLAKMEFFIFFSYLMHQFTLKKPDGSPAPNLEGVVTLANMPVPFDICPVKRN